MRIAERRGKKNREQETHVVSQVIILAIFKRLWTLRRGEKKHQMTRNYFHSFSWSLDNPSVRLAYLRGTFNNSFMPEHSCLFWDNIQGHEEHEIHLPALCKAAAAEWPGLRWRIHEEARRPKLDWYENKNISVMSNSADFKARVLAASVPHSCTNRIDVFYLITPIFWHCSWLHVHSNTNKEEFVPLPGLTVKRRAKGSSFRQLVC